MAKFLSGRQKNLKIGISSYSENLTSLEVIGKVGIGSTAFNPVADLDIRGSLNVRDAINAQIFNVETNTESLITNKATINGNLYVSGIGTINTLRSNSGIVTNISGTNLNYSGIGTIETLRSNSGIVTNISGTNLNYSGITTLGLTSTINLTSQQLFVSGLSTFSGITTHTQSLFGTEASFTGIITATSFRGDGSQLTGVTGTQVVSQPFTSTPVFPILASNSGVSSVGISTTGPNALVFIPSSGNLGIGTTIATSKLTIQGDVLVSGVSTLGTVKISSGIITASSGIVTYYGDGSNLQGIQASSIVGVTSFATNAGIATNLKGGLVGNVPYQSATDTTAFLINGSSGTILQSNGIGNAPSWVSAAPAAAITGLTIRDEGTIVGGANSVSEINFVGAIVSATSSAGIATITFLDYVSNAGIATFATNAGIATFATNAGIATFATAAGIATNVIGGIGSITQLNVSGISTFSNGPVFIGSGTSTGTASQRLQVTGGAYVSDNLGIGTTNPTSKLTVVGDVLVSGILTANRLFSGLYGEFVGGSISGTAIVGTSLSITGISTFTNGPVFIGSGTSTGTASQRLQVTGGAYVSGNLGIGTTNPRANLDVTSSILLSTGVAQTAGFLIKSYTNSSGLISFEDVDNTNPRFSIDRDTSYLFKINDTSFATRLIVNNSGNLGVGTTNPTSKLHIIGDALITGISTLGLGNTSTPPNNSQMSFELTSDTNLRIKVRGTDGVLRSGNITLA